MPKVHALQNNFTGGEIASTVRGRTDIPRYNNSVRAMRNALPRRQGGWASRKGFAYVGDLNEQVSDNVRLIPFVVDATSSFILEFAGAIIRFYKNGAIIPSFSIANPYNALDIQLLRYEQSGGVLYLAHPSYPTSQLVRYADNLWRLTDVQFTEPPSLEYGFTGSSTATLSALTGTITVTTAAAQFLAADTGRQFIAGAGVGTFTFTTATTGSIVVTSAFDSLTYASGAWHLSDSPQATITPSALTGAITLTLSAAGWRTADIGSYVRIGLGVAKITGFTSTTILAATVQQTLEALTPVAAGGWTLEQSSFSAAFGYPAALSFFQQRLVLAATTQQPNTVWLSETGNPTNFQRGIDDADPCEFRVSEIRQIIHVSGSRTLVVNGADREATISGQAGQITPTNVNIRVDSSYGASLVAPVRVGDDLIFVQRAGFKLLAYNFRFESDSYAATDLYAIAETLLTAPLQRIAYCQEPDTVLWILQEDGKLFSLTYDKDQNTIAWAQHPHNLANTFVLDMVAVPIPDDGTGKPSDQLWLITERPFSTNKRRIERYNPSRETDCSSYFTAGVATATWALPTYLNGTTLDIRADGIVQPRQAFTSGNLTLARTALTLEVGLFYETKVELLPVELPINVTAQGRVASVNEISVYIHDTLGLKIDGYVLPEERLNQLTFGVAHPVYTGWLHMGRLGWLRGQEVVTFTRPDSTPVHMLSCVREITVNG